MLLEESETKLNTHSTQFMSKSLSFMSHFFASCATKGLDDVVSQFTSLANNSTFFSLAKLACLLGCLTLSDRRRETS